MGGNRLGQAATAPPEEEVRQWNFGAYWDLFFAVHRSRRYHSKMLNFYQWACDLVLAANALLGTAAFVALVGGDTGTFPKAATGIVAAASALESVLKWSKKAKLHSDLNQRFTDLAAKIELWEPNPANYRSASSERIKIETVEPPIRRLVDIMARNEELRAHGLKDHVLRLTTMQICFGAAFTFGMKALEAQKDAQATDSFSVDAPLTVENLDTLT
jgi:hypothetical protein